MLATTKITANLQNIAEAPTRLEHYLTGYFSQNVKIHQIPKLEVVLLAYVTYCNTPIYQ